MVSISDGNTFLLSDLLNIIYLIDKLLIIFQKVDIYDNLNHLWSVVSREILRYAELTFTSYVNAF